MTGRFVIALSFLLGSVAASAQDTQIVDSSAMIAPAAETSSYNSNLELRTARKMGVGTELRSGGALGFHAELNFEDENAARAAFAIGNGYSSFDLGWKHSFEGAFVTPYTTLGWSRMYGSSGQRPHSYILDSVLSDAEMNDGRFGADFISMAGGVQYNQLDGELQGGTLFGEIQLLESTQRAVLIPAVAVGVSYFF